MPRIDMQSLAEFRQSLPEQQQQEIYRFFMVRWDIVKARFLTRGREPDVLNVTSYANFLGLDKPQTVESAVRVDEARAMSAEIDTNIPVILALIQNEEGRNPIPLLIDGLHRLYKAYRESKETIPCYTLTPDEEKLCRI